MAIRLILIGLMIRFFIHEAIAGTEPTSVPGKAVVEKVGEFRLKDPRDQREVRLSQFQDQKAIVVVFMGTECPINNLYLPYLNQLHSNYAKKGVAFLGINSNRQDTPDRVAEHARKNRITFPVLKDPGNQVADLFGARRTPEAFILNPEGKILYRGRIDDQFGLDYQRPGLPRQQDLLLALDAVLAGKPVAVPETPVAGCLIGRMTPGKQEGRVTYTREVSRILQKNCQECHRPGQVGPFALQSFEDAVSWSETIREVVADRRMPPWHADPRHGSFANDRSLSAQDRKTILDWVDQGCPKGDEKDLPEPRIFKESWAIGTPDRVFNMPVPFEVPAKAPPGGIPYKLFTIPTDFTEDRWVERAECRVGAPEVVHHIVVYIVKKGKRFHPELPVLTGTAPGDMPLMLPPGFAKKIPAGASLVFQMHYTPNGKAQSDLSSVGLIFARDKPKHSVITEPIHPWAFPRRLIRIPAGAEQYPIETTFSFKKDSHILSFMPHMHLRGKDFLFEKIVENNKEILLSVPHYVFGWQTIYRPTQPVAMPRGSSLRCLAHFDNSDKNPNNPNSKIDVYWGDQTWEEMMIGWIDYYQDDETP